MDAALLILDGWGLGAGADPELLCGRPVPEGGRDAVAAAATPTFDRLVDAGAYGTLDTDGRTVGLPEGQMGNSEVGHLTLGAGRAVDQAFTRIDDAIEADELAEKPAIAGAFEYAAESGGRVHLLGLVSDGGVHSHQRHLHALIEAAADRGIEAVTHAVTDGRDTDPHGGVGYLETLAAVAERAGTGAVATVSGRYYAMDRDQNWERTRRAYRAIVDREADHAAESAVAAVEGSYDRGETDEFVEPTLIEGGPPLEAGDALVFFNFRADRARQLVRMLSDVEPEWPFETHPPEVHLATMTEYDREFPFPVAFPPNDPEDTYGEVLAERGDTQLRIAESEKYAHVTYFFNGGREVEFDGELRRIVESPDVPTYDEKPAMSAPEVTDTAVGVVGDRDPDALVLNYANPDMVGHTGDFEAAVAAVEAVDRCLARLVPACREAGAHVLVTADHGNADDMGVPGTPHTAHTTNPVPVAYVSPDGPALDAADSGGLADGYGIREAGTLADVAPTLLSLSGIDPPGAMTGDSLLRP
jgi:2,3-bisphosphoglycerate-independent phosphoglycerate mutase